MSAALHTLGPLRFKCLACGSCCHGVRVELVSEDEAARIERLGAELGVEGAVEDGWLVQDRGRCRFLGADNRCSIHARFGEAAKPTLCRQFPYVVVQTEAGLRGGIDPSSFNLLTTWDDAPEVDDFFGEPRVSEFPPPLQRAEAAVLGALSRPGATVASVLGLLCGAPDAAPSLPPGLGGRMIERLQGMRLDVLLQARDAGPAQVAALGPLLEALDTLDPSQPPAWPALGAREDAYAVEVTRRMVYLRLATRIPLPQGVALLMLTGIVGLAWACPEPDRFGPGVASWARLLRGGSFWQSLTPDPATMQWLASGA